MKLDQHKSAILDSGVEVGSCYYSSLSLTPDGRIASGFDDVFEEEPPLTPAERLEIATFMANHWLEWAAKNER